MGPQLPLSVQLADNASFDNFFAGPNTDALAAAHAAASGSATTTMLLQGGEGSGKSHLLQAIVRTASRHGTAAYLPVGQATLATASALSGLEGIGLLALDDVDQAAGDPGWAQAALRLIDHRRTHGRSSVIACGPPIDRLPPEILPDLRTRLSAMARFVLRPLADADLRALLQARAQRRGLELTSEVAEFLLRRLPRSVPDLVAAIETLDQAALSAQRRLTIPFVQQVLPALAPPVERTARD